MKRKNLTAAVLAGLAGAVGIAGTAQAVNLNPDGLGQVLIYPYYTTNGGNQTIFSVVNTTDQGKAVKVRFLEGSNTREVLDFNLYMSPYDVWVASIFDSANDEDGLNGDGVPGPGIVVPDSTCTVPMVNNASGIGLMGNDKEFFNFAYAGDGGGAEIARAAEGHFEMIEMGILLDDTQNSLSAATHGNVAQPPTTQAIPQDCQQLVDAWSILGGVPGYWLADPTTDISAPTGGLFGGAAVVNAENGTMYSYNAEAVQGFASATNLFLHSEPGTEEPSLNSGDVLDAYIFFDDDGDGVPTATTLSYANGIEAVSAVFMHDTVMNEYITGTPINANTEWVVTFPTKRFYVDPAFAIGVPPVAPFTSVWAGMTDPTAEPFGGTAIAPELVNFRIWDREEQEPGAPPPGDLRPPFSPNPCSDPENPPPGVQCLPDPTPITVMNYEVNVVRFGDTNEDGSIPTPSEILASERLLNVNNTAFGFEAGWVWMDFATADNPNTPAVEPDRIDSQGLVGLPVTGFAIQRYVNNSLEDGVKANYGGIFGHRSTRALQAQTTAQ